nr:zinc finger, CCHC-type [Tanacetum cinerariifolium]
MAATAYLYQALPEDMILQVASCNSAKEIWEALQTRHIGVNRLQKARLQTLKTEFEMLKMKEDDSINEFSAKLNSIVPRASGLRSSFDQQTLVRKLISSVPKRFIQIVAAIEQFTALEETTLDETIGRLKTFKERVNLFNGRPSDNQDKLMFSNHDNSSSHEKCFKNDGQEKFRRNCKLRDKGQGQSNLVQEDVEPMLLMAVQEKGDKGEKIFLNEKEIKPKKTHYKDVDEKISGRVYFGDGSYVKIKGKGSILLECKNKEQRVNPNVYYIPNLKSNILSLGQLTENGCKIIMKNNILLLYGQDKKLLMRVERSRNRLYKINLKVGMPMCLLANLENHAWLWHARLGHLNFDLIKQMTQKKLVEGIPSINHKNRACNACLLGKHSRAPFPNQTNTKSSEPLNLVFGDLCGPISPETESRKNYMFLLVNDCTRYMWVYFLKSKDKALETFKEFKLKVENEVGKKLKSFRTDRGGEFTSREFTCYCKENGILRQLTAPYSPQQNGIVERRNRVPTKALKDSTPYEALKERKPNMRHLRVFGCKAYVKVTKPHLKKLDNRSRELVYLGTEPNSKAYRLFDPVTKDIVHQDSERNDEDSAPSPMQNNTHGDISDDDEIEQPINNPSTPPPYTYEPNSEDSTGYTSSIAKEVYVTQPEGFKKPGNENKVYRLVKALYGLKQAPRTWNMKLDQTLKSLYFKTCTLEQAIYTRVRKDFMLLVGVYVDDLIVTGSKGGISIKQTGYANKILKEARMVDCNETKIPMDPGPKLIKTEGGELVDVTEYKSLIGCLRYLLHTRPDLSYSVGLLSQFMQEPREQHMKAIRQVLRYIKGTLNFGINYYKKAGCKLLGYSDSSYGINIKGGKGKTVIVFYFGNSPISWNSHKQPTVALSSCESEFMAATAAACQALWLQRLLNALTRWKEEKVTIRVDNKSAIALMKNPVFHGRSKHIDIRYHFIRECVKKNQIGVEHISGDLQRADILTKALARIKFAEMRELLGVKELKK